jgi:UDP-glucose 4-epimerase
VLELANTLQRAAGTSVPVEHAPARPGELPRSAVSNAKAMKALNWRPEVNLEDGLRMTYEYFAARTRGARAMAATVMAQRWPADNAARADHRV